MSVKSLTNQTYSANVGRIAVENCSNFSICIQNEDELWHKIWDLYLSVAQIPSTNDAKRQVLLQLVEDTKQQYTKTMKQEKSSQTIRTASEGKAKTSKITLNENLIVFLIILRWFTIILITLIIFAAFIIFIGVMAIGSQSNRIGYSPFAAKISILAPTMWSSETHRTEAIATISNLATDKTLDRPNTEITTTISSTLTITGTTTTTSTFTVASIVAYIDTDTAEDLEAYSITDHKPIFDDHIIAIQLLIISMGLLLLIHFLIVSSYVRPKQIIISVYCIIYWLYRLILTSAANNDLAFIHRIEKIVLLDPMAQHLHLRTLFEEDLLVYTSVDDCFQKLASNHLRDYTLFLPLTTFEVHSFKLSRLTNVSLGIFYEDNNQSHLQISKTKYHIRFMFPKVRLLEHLRHTIILYHGKQAHMYRLQGLEHEADESSLAAIQQCRTLAKDLLEDQAGIINGREPEESVRHDNENVDVSVLPSSTFLFEN